MRIWLAALCAAISVSGFTRAEAQVEKDVVITAQMVMSDEEVDSDRGASRGVGVSPPYVSLVVPADFVIFTVTLETGTRSVDARAKELETAFKAMADRASRNRGVTMEVGYPGRSSAVETALAKETIEDNGDRSVIPIVLKFATQKDDTFGAVRTRAEKFMTEIPTNGRVEAVAGDQQYIGVSEPRKHREALLRKIADDARLLQSIFSGAGGAPTVSMTGLEGRVKYRPSGPLELEIYIPYSIVLGSPQPQR